MTQQVEPLPGSFRHGPWTGECFRDGTLRGMENELCRARTEDLISMSFERNADGAQLTVLVGKSGCVDTISGPVLNRMMRKKDRAGLISELVLKRSTALLATCRIRLLPPVISIANWKKMLDETDGLVNIDH